MYVSDLVYPSLKSQGIKVLLLLLFKIQHVKYIDLLILV